MRTYDPKTIDITKIEDLMTHPIPNSNHQQNICKTNKVVTF